MVVLDHLLHTAEAADRLEDAGAVLDVRLHRLPFVGVERPALIQDGFRDAHLADVVEHAGQAHLLDFRFAEPDRLGQERSVAGYFLRMALRVVVLRVDGKGQRADRFDHSRRQRPRSLSSMRGSF